MKNLIENKKSDQENYAVKKGILIYINKNFNNTGNTVYQICVPARIAPKLVQHFHKNVFFQHMDKKKLILNLSQKIKIQGISKIVQKCQICVFNKSYNNPRMRFGKNNR